MDRTGTDAFPQVVDLDGSLWERFGTGGRSTFLFVNDDGTFTLTSFGVIGEDELTRQVQNLIDS